MKLKLIGARPDEKVSVDFKTTGTSQEVAEALRAVADKLYPEESRGLLQIRINELQDELNRWQVAAKTLRCARCFDEGTVMIFDQTGFPHRGACPECRPLRLLQATTNTVAGGS